MDTVRNVIVVGGGAAGIAAATRLYENGIKNILILEAENRIGGRIHTFDLDCDAGFVELGAQWIHGEENNVTFEIASARNLHQYSDITFRNMLCVQSSAKIIDKNISDEIMEGFERLRNSTSDLKLDEYKSSGDYFLARIEQAFSENENDSITSDLLEQFTEWFHLFINSVDGSDTWFDSSVTTLEEYWECPGNSYVSWKEYGYRTILSLLLEKCQEISMGNFEKQNIITNSEVIKICMDGNNVCVQCVDGTKYTSDFVIVTVSLGVLKEKYIEMFESGILSSEKIMAIKGLSIGSVNKMYLKFPYQWWPANINGFNFMWTQEDRKEYATQGLEWLTDVMSFTRVDHAPLFLCGWIVGQSSRIMEKLNENDVKIKLTELLKKFLGNHYSIPEPTLFLRSTWTLNEHFRGSYSFRSPETDKLKVNSAMLSSPLKNQNDIPVVLFAGEATHSHYYSTVHGAIESGWREADRILSYIKNE